MDGYREIEVYIGPLQEWKGMSNVNAIKLVCNGNRDTLRIDTSISKSIRSLKNTATVTIYNLSEETRNALKNKSVSIKIYAGLEGQEKEMVFGGGILAATSYRQGPNIITKLSCRTGIGPAVKAVVSTTYTHGVPVKDIVRELASKLDGVTVDPTNINVEGTIGYAGWSYAGYVSAALDKLAYQFGFSWTDQDGKFVAIQDGKSTNSKLLLDSEHGLRKVSPRLTGPLEVQEGVDIQATYCPGANPGSQVSLRSEFEKRTTSFIIHSVSYTLSPKTDSWDMSISSFKNFGVAWGGKGSNFG